ncbi:MAG: hypothetical protein QOJ29_205 [Thermoleophilaceae bacterium]|nr:hypothetical protein [Thermoleophilaceae bacterium]
MRLIKTLVITAIAAALLLVPAGALAKSRDRDHDRMPDKWEKKHHLNPRAKDARKDPDKDHLSNLAEYKNNTDPQKADTDDDGVDDENELADNTNPRKDDSDDDGVEDGDEVSGTVVSFENGVLTIQRAAAGGGTVAGTVNASTKIECDDHAPSASASSDDGEQGDDHGDRNDSQGDQGGDGDHGDDDNASSCTSADLKPGARVHEAKTTQASDGSTVFSKIELAPAG